MSSTRAYVLNNRVLSLYQSDTICYHCGAEIEIGEKVVTKRRGGGKRKMYHRKCASELNIVISRKSKEVRTKQ